MKKRGMIVVAAIILLLPLVLASSIDDEIKKLTYYAEEYETGNINYVQLVTYTSAIRENLNQLLGAANKEDGGILKQEQIKKVLGEPTQYTGWVWVEGEEKEKRVDEDVPFWEKIVFDGKKIQIRMNSYPSIFKKRYSEDQKDKEKQVNENDGKLIYRLNFYTEFKRPKDSIDINNRINEINELAKIFNSDSSIDNAEKLAKESVNAEKSFESYFKQSGQSCEDVMNSLFGAENKREEQKLIVNEFDYYRGDEFDARARLELCDDCSNHYANIDVWLDTRGKINMPEEKNQENKFEKITFEEFKSQINSALEKIKSALDKGDFEGFVEAKSELRSSQEAWNQASNDVWKELDKEYQEKGKVIGKDNPDPYWWVALEKEKRDRIKQIQEENYQKTKEFYNQIFSGYDKSEFFFEQVNWEKRVIEEFQESGEEICNNNLDDNNNGQIDCAEDQCAGKICGWSEIETKIETQTQIESSLETETVEIENETTNSNTEVVNEIKEGTEVNTEENNSVVSVITGNAIEDIEGENTTEIETVTAEETTPTETTETNPATEAQMIKKKVPLYCMNMECKAKEESFIKTQAICGNHICEQGENCLEDCSTCPGYEVLPCKGKVIFSGEDENGCPLEPVCIEEKSCEKNEDCPNPLCGIAECIKENGVGMCKTTKLEECKEAECTEGEEKAQVCENNEKKIIKICQEGKWVDTGVSECEILKEEAKEEELVGSECSTKGDCGGADDVCSNGKCVTLPKTEEIEEEEKIKEEQQETQGKPPEQEEQTPKEPDASQLTAAVITGHQTQETVQEPVETKEAIPQEATQETQPREPRPEPTQTTENRPPNEQPQEPNQENLQEEQNREEERRQEENQRRQEEDRERRTANCKENSQRECANRYVMDCVGQCVFKDNKEQDLETCKKDCEEEHKQEIDDCISQCEQTCEKEDWCKIDWPQGENKQEKGVFTVGGMCRTSQQKSESFIFFNGWGEPFNRLQSLKNKYYSGGESDWCKLELENLITERKEIEKSLNQDYAVWFLEKYLANSAEDWEQHVSGIYEIYWRVVENERQMIKMIECSGKTSLPEFNLININYSTEYGSLQLWEEKKVARIPEFNQGKEMEVVSPYMKLWIFPPEEFIKSEMKEAMETGEFPGSPEEKLERKNQGGLKEEEKENIRNDAKFMKKITKLADKHGGSYDGVVQIKDFKTDEVVFNLFVKVNENDILSMEPMLPSKVPETDAAVTLDWNKIYELVGSGENMEKEKIQIPPWEKEEKTTGEKFNEVVNGIKMFFKIRDLINSAEYSPKDSKSEIKSLFNSFILMMMKNNKGPEEKQLTDEEKKQVEEIKDEVLDSKEAMTGEIILEWP